MDLSIFGWVGGSGWGHDHSKGKGSKKRLWKIPYRVLTPPLLWIFFYFFSETRPFLRTFCKKCIFTIENPKKNQKIFQKMIKLPLDKQIFASSDARFCRSARSNGRYTQNFVHNTCNFSLDMILSPQNVSMKPRGGLRSPKGGPPPYT